MLALQAATDKAVEKSAIPTRPNFDPGLWQTIGGFLWVIVAALVVWILRAQIADLLQALIIRIKKGGALKIFGIELDAIRVSSSTELPKSGILTAAAASDEWRKRRNGLYVENRHVFIAHRLFPSEVKGQLYDILIYLVPHRDRNGSLRNIQRVEYYFGDSWGNRVFTSSDPGKRFGIVVSAFGSGFLCLAEIYYRDGTEPLKTWRYIDFEMGVLGDG